MRVVIRMAILITTTLFYIEVSKISTIASGSCSSTDFSVLAGFGVDFLLKYHICILPRTGQDIIGQPHREISWDGLRWGVRIAWEKSDVTTDLPRGLLLTNQGPLVDSYRLNRAKPRYELGNYVLVTHWNIWFRKVREKLTCKLSHVICHLR